MRFVEFQTSPNGQRMGILEKLKADNEEAECRVPDDSFKARTIVVDTSALIHSTQPLVKWITENPSARILTVPQVFQELKDEVSRKSLEFMTLTLGKTIETKVPDKTSLAKVIEEARLSGDLASLSIVDLNLIALTLMMQPKENYISGHRVGTTGSRSETVAKPTTVKSEEALISQNWYEDVSSSESTGVGQLTTRLDALNVEDAEDQGSCPESDRIPRKRDDGWITPVNIKSLHWKQTAKEFIELPESDETYVSCMTSDFAMQNLLLRLNIPLLSFDGRLITRIQNWVMRCHACFK
jgi:RNA-binding protein NOB1